MVANSGIQNMGFVLFGTQGNIEVIRTGFTYANLKLVNRSLQHYWESSNKQYRKNNYLISISFYVTH